MARDLTYGAAAIRRLLRRLEKPETLAHQFAVALLQQAKQNAAAKPTPQARMAAENMSVQGDTIAPQSEGPAADVAIGSEFGSNRYPQFHRGVNPRGYWLYPAAEAPAVLATGDRALEDVLRDAIRGGALG